MTIPIDPRIADSVTITPGPRPGWALKEILYFLDNEQSVDGIFQAQQAVMWAWAREPGQKIGHGVATVRFRYCFPTFTPSGAPPNGDEAKQDTDQRGLCNFSMAGNSWDAPTDKGVYFIHPVAKGQVTGDIVGGMGIKPSHHHADYVLVYEYESAAPPEPPPKPPPVGTLTEWQKAILGAVESGAESFEFEEHTNYVDSSALGVWVWRKADVIGEFPAVWLYPSVELEAWGK